MLFQKTARSATALFGFLICLAFAAQAQTRPASNCRT